MSSTSLNLIAIGVFTLTLFTVVGPLFNVSPVVPAGITAVVLGLGALDTLSWQNRGSDILLELFAPEAERERVIHHEAGHFLVAYHLGVPIKDYTVTAWSAWKKGYPGKGGVQFDYSEIELTKLVTVLLAGIAAEMIIYGKAEGGESDRQQVSIALSAVGLSTPAQRQKVRNALASAQQILQENQQSYQSLVSAMSQGLSVAECYGVIS
ncbi:ATP-dependent Zn protease [Gloeocapsa sp. PCC 73106]|uniref:ATP-dependent Zn protease n=1 Tax=Gloeocapsa sp. PCC 73106 TaxID=102232 RepID=UPI0002AC4DB9|nr:ATP-dependent Zn protease [Gloeocapsa sp. PCC 73106]ELR97994.1 ATP-dependent Zn protease [Gloeocapsa sp. PCC 73106]